jgi:hypothetical protein
LSLSNSAPQEIGSCASQSAIVGLLYSRLSPFVGIDDDSVRVDKKASVVGF